MAAADYRLMTEATGQRIALALENLAGFGAYLTTADVIDNLISTATDKPGSANMLKTLNDKFKRIQLSDVTIFEAESISAGGVKTGSFTITVPSGFSVASITLKLSNNYFTTGVSRIGQNWYYTVKNEYTSALSVSLSALILFKENDTFNAPT